jgi:quinol monooxygenase YgiN
MCNITQMIMIAGHTRVKTDRLDDVLDAAREMAALSRREPGCVDYRFAIDIEDPSVVRIFERWESQAALDAHFATNHFVDFSALIVDVVEGDSEFMRYEIAQSGPLFG